jgi:hypothetical protein
MRLAGNSVNFAVGHRRWELQRGGAKLPGSAQVKGGDLLCDPKPPQLGSGFGNEHSKGYGGRSRVVNLKNFR